MGLGLDKGEKIFCIYLNDDDTQRQGFYVVVDFTDNSITLQTREGILLLPMGRILKIKRGNEK